MAKLFETVDTQVLIIMKAIGKVMKKLTENIMCDDNGDGLLTHSLLQYHDCLKLINREKLKYLLHEDQTYWEDKLFKLNKQLAVMAERK